LQDREPTSRQQIQNVRITEVVRPGEVRTPTLTVVAGPLTGRWVSVGPERRAVVLGRDDTTDLCLDDTSVSRRHARVWLEEDGGEVLAIVQDIDSTNGTFVNGQRIQRARLCSGDRVHLGDVLLRFEMLDQIDLRFRREMARRVEEGERDSLTGLWTRRALDDQLAVVLARTQHRGESVSVVMVDLDHFKAVNDTWGHLMGDEVLRAAGQVLREHVRRDDIAVRFGGEELLVILPGTARLHARLLAERLREGIASTRFTQAPALRVTASFGVAEKETDETIESWLGRADQALYQAKAGGRNRTEAAPARG
jgi:diguanylate cyclase (GGDEF)-like protein